MVTQINSTLNTIAKGAAIFFFALIIGKVIGLGTRIITARYLGPDKYGLLSLGFSMATIITSLVLLGIPQAVTRFLSYYKDKKEKFILIVPTSLKIVLPAALVLSTILFLFSKSVSIYIYHNEQLTNIIRIFAIMIPFSVVSQIFLAALQALKKTKEAVFTSDIVLGLTQFIGIVLFLYLGYDLIGVSLAYVLAYVAIAIMSFYFLKHSDIQFRARSNSKILRKLLTYSVPLVLATIISIAFRQTDVIFLSIFKTTKETGIYSAVFPIAQMIKFIGGSFSFLFFPMMAELCAQNKLSEISKIYKTTARWSAFIAIPIGTILIIFPKFVLQLFYGKEYIAGTTPLIILTVSYIIACLLSRSYELLIANGNTKKIFWATVIGFGLNILINLLLIPKYGAIGAAIGAFSSVVVMYSFTLLFVFQQFKFTLFSKGMIKSIIAAVISATIIYCINLFVGSNILIIGVSFVLFLILYFVILIVLHSFSQEDVQLIVAIRNHVGIRLYWLERLLSRFAKK